jgi:hypothetical protein
MTTPGPTPQSSGPPWAKIIGIGCGCLILAGILFATVFAILIGKAVGGKTPLPASQQQYAGDWQGADGTTLSIRADGGGDFKSGGQSVSGGKVKLDEAAKTLRIELLGIKKTWTIDEPPHNEGGTTVMKLSGTEFRRTAGFTPPGPGGPGTSGGPGAPGSPGGSSSRGPGPSGGPVASTDGVPSPEELRGLVTGSLLDLNRAVQAKDFTAFYNTLHPIWKYQTTAEGLRGSFQSLIDKEANIAGIKDVAPNFDPAPSITRKGKMQVLEAAGSFPTTPRTVTFDLKYAPDENTWKLVGVNVNIR